MIVDELAMGVAMVALRSLEQERDELRAIVADLARVYTAETDQAPLLALVQRARQLMEGR